MKKGLYFIAGLLLLAACGNNAKENKEEKAEPAKESIVLTAENFLDEAPNFVGKEVDVQGLVVHICKHGGKRMFLQGKEEDDRIKIMASDKISEFDTSLEGSTVKVKGVLSETRYDEAALDEWEAQIKAENPEAANEKAEGVHMGIHKEGEDHEDEEAELQADPFKQVNDMRTKLKESGKEALIFYSIEIIGFEEVK